MRKTAIKSGKLSEPTGKIGYSSASKKDLYNLLKAIKSKRPVLAHVLKNYENFTVSKYIETFSINNASPIQERKDLITITYKHTKRLLGPEVAIKIRKELSANPVILTGNHHGPDYLAFSIQGSLLFALSKSATSVLPVFACGGIPQNNTSYPRGIITSDGIKINIFPDKDKHQLVSATKAFTSEMIQNSIKQLARLHEQNKISEQEHTLLRDILENDYLSKEVIEKDSFSSQSTVINHKLWKRIFSNVNTEFPEIVSLEIEKIASELVALDIKNENALLHQIFFNTTLRDKVLKNLNSTTICWNLEQIEKTITIQEHANAKVSTGTVFFWGIDEQGRRYPLLLKTIHKKQYLVGITSIGKKRRFMFSKRGLSRGLKSHKLLPSLFTCYAAIAFARGYKCYGGFMQTDYLTEIKKGLGKALKQSHFHPWAKSIDNIPTENFLTGLISIVKHYKGDTVVPAGTLDLISTGGIVVTNLSEIKDKYLKDINMLSIPAISAIISPEQNVTYNNLFNKYYKNINGNLIEIR